ncbi:hypothetical protein [Pseudomonas sp. NPDC089741]|uniref:hypothetical protein n=1 Tax=Pseudomonas sp. NPDC089741 TaxID=3364470 RepID=UPI0038027B54
MPAFALVTEGITDQVLVESLVTTILEDEYGIEVDINVLQPLLDETDNARQKKESFGGFEKVLDYCSDQEKIQDALAFNNYLIIQIDTDSCEHPAFGLNLYRDGSELSPRELVTDVTNLLISRISTQFYSQYNNRIIFAITVHSTECWLLPFYNTKGTCKTKNCQQHLNNELNKQNISYNKDGPIYRKLCKPALKLKNIDAAARYNSNLGDFIGHLKSFAPFQVTIT